jgi:pimeloyl-ACP methyl ester carboxylesterase
MSHVRGAAVVVVAALFVAACTSPAPRAVESNSVTPETEAPSDTSVTDDTTTDTVTSPPADDALDWGPCPEEDTPSIGEVECATVTVPLDYDEPDGKTIDLALIRVPAGGDREGAVLTNPGGPGGSGVDFIVNAGPTIQTQMDLGDFDIVGFDPRGVDRSNGIQCLSDELQDEYLYVDQIPENAAEETLLDESRDAYPEACRQEYGDDLVHYSTENTARDMDAIRAALGDEQLSFLGISYGTYLGAVYARLFPERVRAMVLDSAYEPTGDTIDQQYITQLVGFEGAFDNWAAWCAADEACPFHAPAADAIGARWDALYDGLDARSVELDGRTVNAVTLMSATAGSMYSEASWPDLAAALAAADEGDVSGILRIADTFEQRKPDGTYASIGQSGPVIRCASGISEETPDDPEALLAEMQVAAPRFSRGISVDELRDPCPDLIGQTVEPVEPSYAGDGPILVIGGENDPATPFRWAEELTAALGEDAVLVTYTGEGHGQLLGSECITELEADVLSDADVPDGPETCDPDPPVEKPDWWDDLPVPDGVSDVEAIPALTAALGLTPSTAYAELRLTDLSADEVQTLYREELEAEDFTFLVDQEALPDVLSSAYSPPEFGTGLIILTLPPEAFDNEELASLAAEAPDGKTVVVIAAVSL